jgi:hypothetical protein
LALGQAPSPSQLEAKVNVNVVSSQLAALHSVSLPLAKATQALVSSEPSQVSTPHSPSPRAQASRGGCGSPATGEQRPSRPATSHASHCPAQGESQQTPSAQCPEPQSSSAEQSVPSST